MTAADALAGRHAPCCRGYFTPCWVWLRGKITAGYGETFVDGRVVYAHRASYELHVGPIPPDHDVHHRCEQRDCINPAHLEAKPHREHAATKLTAEDAREIRRVVAAGERARATAEAFGVSERLVNKIVRRECWATV